MEKDDIPMQKLCCREFAQRLDRWLYAQGIRNRKGRNFTNSTIINMLKNITYVGILKSGKTKSEAFPERRIVPVEL